MGIATGITYKETITLVTETCCNCGVSFAMPSDLRNSLQNDPSKSFYCPNGHGQHYRKSKEQRLREEAEAKLRTAQEALHDSDTVKLQLQKKLKTASKKLDRVTNGVCPCCNRNFVNLKRHLKTKHPELFNK